MTLNRVGSPSLRTTALKVFYHKIINLCLKNQNMPSFLVFFHPAQIFNSLVKDKMTTPVVSFLFWIFAPLEKNTNSLYSLGVKCI
jgi:hypothetical protein